MKKILLAAMLFASVFPAQYSHAEEEAVVTLTTPADLIQQACPTPVWKEMPVRWQGVKDRRTFPEVGIQTQKGEKPIPVLAAPPLDETFDSTLKKLLSACGMKFVSGESEDALNLAAEIREFYVGVEKKLVTGKSTAKSSIAFVANRGGQSTSVTVGNEIESKKIRSGNIKQLTKTLDELFTATLIQIPATQEIKDLK